MCKSMAEKYSPKTMGNVDKSSFASETHRHECGDEVDARGYVLLSYGRLRGSQRNLHSPNINACVENEEHSLHAV